MTGPLSPARAADLVRAWYADGLRAVDPCLAVERALSWDGSSLMVQSHRVDVPKTGRVVGAAFGKAAMEMAKGLTLVAGDRIDSGIVLTKDGHISGDLAGWRVFEASHPVPDARGAGATRTILDEISRLDGNDVAIVLVSGGGSALLESPRAPLTLEDIQDTTRLMLRAGAPIQHMNAVRSELSEVKGGGLRAAIGDATCISLILSDVLGNDPAVIASGPTIARVPNPGRALELLDQYGLTERVPQVVIDVLSGLPQVAHSPDTSRDAYAVIGDNDIFIDAVAGAAKLAGFTPTVAQRLWEGESRDLAREFVAQAISQPEEVDVVIGGGEATVTVTGDGRGGRNTEFALEAAVQLRDLGGDWVIASLASDGQDGAIDAAGAIVDRRTVDAGAALDLDARMALDNNDSGGYFERTGTLVVPGPTGTNVNDVYVAVRVSG